VGREKFFKCNFFINYLKIKNHKKWGSKKKETRLEKGKNKAHIIHRLLYFFFLELLFYLFSKAMWVAIDCHSKNWVLKCLGSTALPDCAV
jgi:hypothetical protein